MSRQEFAENFWVLESKEVDLYFGMQCGQGHYWVGINDAVHFATKEDALKMKMILERDFNLKFNHEPVEHGYTTHNVHASPTNSPEIPDSSSRADAFKAQRDVAVRWLSIARDVCAELNQTLEVELDESLQGLVNDLAMERPFREIEEISQHQGGAE